MLTSRLSVPCFMLAASLGPVPAALASIFMPTSATRTLSTGGDVVSPIAQSTTFGFFSDSRGGGTGAGSPPTSLTVSCSQSSTIETAIDAPAVVFNGTAGASRIAGATTNRTGSANSTLVVNFLLTQPATLTHTLLADTAAGGSASAVLRNQANISTDLLAPGNASLALTPQSYQITLSVSSFISWGTTNVSYLALLNGSISFVPAPAAAGLLILAPWSLSRRRRALALA